MKFEFPEKLAFLFEPYRYKVAYGGRGGLKSWNFSDALLLSGAQQYERVLCARETMDSIAESVHHLLEQRIDALGLRDVYRVQQATILGPEWPGQGQTQFVFAGLRHNVHNIKSLEGVTKCWVEEAQSVSKHSWETLLPTIRWEDKARGRQSEVWVSFNPRLASDDTYKRFVVHPPPGAKVVKTTYRDNKWLPEVLRIELEHMWETD